MNQPSIRPPFRQSHEPGSTIADRYQVEDLLGRGGMATVYRARDLRTGSIVALKRGLARDAIEATKRRVLLQREYHTLEQLRHPRIIEVYDYGVDAAGPFYTMELLDGADLDSSGRVPWREACALLRDVASSLAIMHSRGLLHRDISPRNVRRTADGRAKLIDFGAMTTTGVAVDVVGTPPFIAPEVLQVQPLDARADLFSLGALAYFVLSGRHAYPCRTIAELRDVWRSRPMPLARLVPDLPPALDALVMQLLALDRNARPEHAAEAISRLCAIAALPSDEQDAVSYAYLKMPSLVGREAALIAIRKQMLALARGDGGALYVEGVAGSGRSRMLDATVIEAKLAGAVVIRADARTAGGTDFGLAHALFNQLCTLLPQEADKAARLATSLDRLAPRPANAERTSIPPVANDETLLIRELRDFVLALCRTQRLVITVDDADRIDERSAALLNALGYRAERHPLLLVFSVDRDQRATRSPALRMVCSSAEHVEIDELSAEQCEALLRSVFGDVAHLTVIAGRIAALSQGNPRAALGFAQHLVDSKLARYEAGRWSLPAYLGDHDLPQTLSASLSLRLSVLSADARELCDALALADGDGVSLLDYTKLTFHADENRTFAALDELIAARVLTADGERYAFGRGFVAVLCDEIKPTRAQPMHSRIADWLAGKLGADVVRRAHHLLGAGREIEAIDLLRSVDPRARLPLPLLERAVDYAVRENLDLRTILRLRTAIVLKAAHVLASDSFWRHGPTLLAQLEHDCGLARYHELDGVEPAARLAQALRETKERYDQTAPRLRGYALLEGFQELARVYGAFCAYAMAAVDPSALDRLPALDPLIPISPALDLIRKRSTAARAWIRGDMERCAQAYEEIIARVAEPDRGGLDELRAAELVLNLNYGLGAIEASRGSAHAERRAQLLEGHAQTRGIAWMLRQVLALNQGNLPEARRCLRRAELYRLQLGLEGPPPTLAGGIQLLAHSRLGSVLGVKAAVDDLTIVAANHPGWQPVLLLGRSHYHKLSGDLDAAIAPLEQALALMRANGTLYFSPIAAAHVDLLSALGRDREAAERAREYLDRCDPEEKGQGDADLCAASALALSRGGEHARAVRLLDNAIAYSVAIERKGMPLGTLYYARARLAIAAAQREELQRFADLCAEELKRAKTAATTSRFERLLQEAARAGLAPQANSQPVQELLDLARSQSVYVTLQSRMDECFDPSDRARCALTLLLEHVQGFTGYLYGVNESRVQLLAALADEAPDLSIDRWVHAHVRAECDSQEQHSENDQAPARRYVDSQGHALEPILLLGNKDGAEHLAAVFVHEPTPNTQPADRTLLRTLAEALLARDDVKGAKLDSVITA